MTSATLVSKMKTGDFKFRLNISRYNPVKALGVPEG